MVALRELSSLAARWRTQPEALGGANVGLLPRDKVVHSSRTPILHRFTVLPLSPGPAGTRFLLSRFLDKEALAPRRDPRVIRVALFRPLPSLRPTKLERWGYLSLIFTVINCRYQDLLYPGDNPSSSEKYDESLAA